MLTARRLLWVAPLVLVVALFFSLYAGAEVRGRVRASATANGVAMAWVGSGGGVCYGVGSHLPGFGGALGITDTYNCLCYYTQVSNTGGGWAQSPACQSPSSVYTSGTPSNSWHLGCVGIFNCGGFVARH